MADLPKMSAPVEAVSNRPPRRGPNSLLIIGIVLAGCCLFGMVVLVAIIRPVFMQARETGMAITCLSREKAIATNLLLYATDHDDRFPLVDVVRPFSLRGRRRGEICPKSQQVYHLNPDILGVSPTKLATPSKVPVVYEGTNQQPSFIHKGQSTTAFADGSARHVSPSEELGWKPALKK